MSKILLALLIVVLFGYWLYCLTTYNWDNFEEDQEQAKKDFF